MRIFPFHRAWAYVCALSVIGVLSGCSNLKSTSVTWEEIAQTIPSDPKYVVSVNRSFAADSALNGLWASPDVMQLMSTGLNLDTEQPSHLVVAAMDEATFITWPVPNPRETDEKISGWDTASLNNTPDARIKVLKDASIVISSTQIWVVNNSHGEYYVNKLLSKAMNTKAANSPILNNCIISEPSAANAVIPYNDRFYTIEMAHSPGQMRVEVDAYDKFRERLDIVGGLGRLSMDFVDSLSDLSPFAAIQMERGSMPDFIRSLARMAGDNLVTVAAEKVVPLFEGVSGTVMAHWDNDKLNVALPFASQADATNAELKLKRMADAIGRADKMKLSFEVENNILLIKAAIHSPLPPVDQNRKTPHIPSLNSNPSAIAFGRFDIGLKELAEVYFELDPQRATLRIDYEESKANTAKVVQLIKTIIFRTL